MIEQIAAQVVEKEIGDDENWLSMKVVRMTVNTMVMVIREGCHLVPSSTDCQSQSQSAECKKPEEKMRSLKYLAFIYIRAQ